MGLCCHNGVQDIVLAYSDAQQDTRPFIVSAAKADAAQDEDGQYMTHYSLASLFQNGIPGPYYVRGAGCKTRLESVI